MKILLPISVCAIALCGTSFSRAAAEVEADLVIVTEREQAIYAKGEPVRFIINAKEGTENLTWILSRDGITPLKEGTVALHDGSAVVEGAMDQPGFLRLIVRTSMNGKPFKAIGSAAVAPEEIAHGVLPPDDFESFWLHQKELLARIPISEKRVSIKLDKYPEVEMVDLKVTCLGAPVSGYYAKPGNAEKGKHPAILLLHGAGVGGALSDRAGEWAKQGALALDINAHGLPNGESSEFYEKLRKDYLYAYSVREKVSREHHYFVGMILRVLRAIDFLASQPEWNGRLAVFGTSQGGAQAVYGAGLDERVGFIAAGVPAYSDVTASHAGRAPGWPRFVYDEKQQILPEAVGIARYFDLVNFVRRTKAGGIYTVSFLDVVSPPDSVYSLYNAHPGKKAIHHDPRHGHANVPEAGKAMRTATRRYLFAK